MTSRGTSDFWKLYWWLPEEVRTAARAAYQKFQQNRAHPSLQLERIRADPRFWSVRVTRDYRAVAQRFPDDTWIWIWIAATEISIDSFPLNRELNALQAFSDPRIIRAASHERINSH